MTQTATLDEFVNQLILDKKFENLDEEVGKTIHQELVGRVNDTIIAKTLAALSDADIRDFNEFLDANPPGEKIQEFVASKIPDGTNFLANILIDFRKNYLGL